MIRGVASSLVLVLLAAGCGSGSGSGNVMSDAEVVSLCDELIAEFESGCSAAQLDELAAIELRVAGYAYVPASPRYRDGTVTVEPTDPAHLYRMYGIAGFMQGKLGPAVWASAMALREEPKDPTALMQLAVMLLEKGRCDEARRLLEKAKREDPENNELIRLSLAVAYSCLGKIEQSAEALDEAASLAPDSAMVERASRELFERELADVLTMQDAFSDACANDIVQALHLGTTGELSGFVMQKNQEAQALAMEALTLVTRLPMDLPPEFHSDLAAIDDRYQQTARTKYEDPANEAVDAIMDEWSDGTAALAEQEGSCCASMGGHCCPCIEDNCTGNMDLISSQIQPDSFGALTTYLPGRIRLLQRYETDLQRLLFRVKGSASKSSVEWAASYAYNLLAQNCKAVALSIAHLVEPPLTTGDFAAATCELPNECWDAAWAAELEQKRLAAEEERQRKAQEEERKALAAQAALDLQLSFEICADGLGCLGVSGTQVSFKVGGEIAFAQFSVDVETLDVGVRAGLGVGDPTGNIIGADISAGLTLGPQGASFDVTCSAGGLLGTKKVDVSLFKLRHKF